MRSSKPSGLKKNHQFKSWRGISKSRGVKNLFKVTVFSVAMAYVESAVVVYLREIYYPGGFKFPLKILTGKIILIEVGREVATLVMLGAVAFLVARSLKEKLAYFFFSFGVWDIFYYIWLKIFLGWPPSLLAWDVLFLIPVPWVGPVLAPLLVSLLFVLSGASIAILEEKEKSLQFSRLDILFFLLAAAIIILSFTWNFKTSLTNPNALFNWGLFLSGYFLGLIAFCKAFLKLTE
jgi:hypothetical protein